MTPRLTLYTGADCPLCEQAHRLVSDLSAEFGWEWREQNIDEDPALLARFGQIVPVVDIEDGPALFGALRAEDLLTAMAERKQ